jgi:peptidoglycan/LPS O-acetylase OafA/YrhL
VESGAAGLRFFPIAGAGNRTLTPARLPFRGDIQGLRGIAVLLVVLYHVGIPRFAGGFIGVDVFFVLSGFLISGLLIEETKVTGRIDFAAFFARRIRRLLPASALMLITTLIAASLLLSPIEQITIGKAALATAFYGSNFFFMRNGVSYFDARVEDNPLLHTWSLGVEEQFYLVWPFLLLLCVRLVRGTAKAVGFAALAGVSFALCVWLSYRYPAVAFYSSPSRVWQFALGALGWLAVAQADRLPAAGPSIGWTALAVLIGSALLITRSIPYPGVVALVPSLATAAILATSAPVLANPLLQWLGKVSYTWYLWHWPILVFATLLVPGLTTAGKLVAVTAALAISYVSHVFLENPLRYHPRLVRHARRSILLGAAITAGAAAVGLGLYGYAVQITRRPEQQPFVNAMSDRPGRDRGCMSAWRDKTFAECTFGNAQSPRIIVLFGDSHAEQWLPVLEGIARGHSFRLVTFLRGACPVAIVEPSVQDAHLQECSQWQKRALARIAALRPNAVILGSYQASFANPAFASDVDRGGQWTRAYHSLFTSLTVSGSQIVVLRDSPRPHTNVPLCLSRAEHIRLFDKERCDIPRDAAFDTRVAQAQQAAALGVDVHFVDLTARFCDASECPAVINEIVVYRDDSHVTTRFAHSLTRDLENDLMPLLTPTSTVRFE